MVVEQKIRSGAYQVKFTKYKEEEEPTGFEDDDIEDHFSVTFKLGKSKA